MAAKKGHALVVFDEESFDTDLERLSTTGRRIARSTRKRYETDGVPLKQLRSCDAEGRDGTSLPSCLKVYLPAPNGRFGMVLLLAIATDGPRLRCIATGVRHHPGGSHALTVYQIADMRLSKVIARDLRSKKTPRKQDNGKTSR